MQYVVGSRVDLSYLNIKIKNEVAPAVVSAPKQTMLEKTMQGAYDVGTQISFQLVNKQFTSARRIPVVFA